MASGQTKSPVESGDESQAVIPAPAAQTFHVQENVARATETSSASAIASARPSLPFYSLSLPWTRSLGTSRSIKFSGSTSKWQTIHSAINTTATILAMFSFPLVVFGAWMAWAALKASWWAQSKEEFEWCEDHDFDYPGCEALKGQSLSIPTDPSPFKRSGNMSSHKNTRCPPAHLVCWARFNRDLIMLFAILSFMSSLQITMFWVLRGRIKQLALGFLKFGPVQHNANHQELEEVLVLSETEVASSTDTEATLEAHPEAFLGTYSKPYAGGSSGSLRASRGRFSRAGFAGFEGPYATREVYRSSATKDSRKTATNRSNAIGRSAYASGYNRNEPRSSYSSSSYRAG